MSKFLVHRLLSIIPTFYLFFSISALSVQRGYSLSSGANLLAANYNNPKKGNGGSGIYFGNGTIAENYVDGIKITKLIIHEVPKIGKRYNNRCSSIKVILLTLTLNQKFINN